MTQFLLVEELLKERNLSFNRLADLTGIKRTTLYYGLNNNKISLKYLSKIAEALECSVSELIPDEVDR
jgi:DNA-binding Xre family transcriptional regulator